MTLLTRWMVPALLATGLGMAGLAPTAAHAQSGDELVRVIVDVADVIMRGGQPYYRHGYNDRVVVVHDRYGRPSYYRHVPRGGYHDYRARYDAPRYPAQRTRCNRHGRCKVEYYDPRYDRRNDYGYSRWGDHRGHRGYEDRRRWRGRYDD